jgi:hypothetical protein
MVDPAFITSTAGVAFGAIGSYWTVKTYYLKRQDEQRDRQRQELDRAQAEIDRQKVERQLELDKYADGKKREYAAERDFGHLMRQYEALSLNLNTLHELGDRRLDGIEADLRDIKGLLQMLAVAVGQTETGIQRYLKREE